MVDITTLYVLVGGSLTVFAILLFLWYRSGMKSFSYIPGMPRLLSAKYDVSLKHLTDEELREKFREERPDLTGVYTPKRMKRMLTQIYEQRKRDIERGIVIPANDYRHEPRSRKDTRRIRDFDIAEHPMELSRVSITLKKKKEDEN
jgi:hypothetical protein